MARARRGRRRRGGLWLVVRRVLLAVLSIVVLVAAGVVVWFAEGDEVSDGAIEAVLDQGGVRVDRVEDAWRVLPTDREPTGTLVLYPGARVEPAAYVPTLAPTVRRTGIAVVVPTMPINVALLRTGRASSVRETIRDADGEPLPGPWVVGGHSLGGVAAAMFLDDGPTRTWDGLLLLASFPSGGEDLSGDDLAALAVAGTDDGLTAIEDVREGMDRLPPDARLVEVDGLNHAGFGRYGRQLGDHPPGRPDDETLADLTAAISSWLEDEVVAGSAPS